MGRPEVSCGHSGIFHLLLEQVSQQESQELGGGWNGSNRMKLDWEEGSCRRGGEGAHRILSPFPTDVNPALLLKPPGLLSTTDAEHLFWHSSTSRGIV